MATNQPGPISGIFMRDKNAPSPVQSTYDPNRGDPNQRKAAKLVVEEPKAAPAPAAPVGPTPQQIAAQQAAAQQAAAIAAQQAQFWANHAAAQRMKGG
jgi:hypothetical protein